jgi:hypothetical protein
MEHEEEDLALTLIPVSEAEVLTVEDAHCACLNLRMRGGASVLELRFSPPVFLKQGTVMVARLHEDSGVREISPAQAITGLVVVGVFAVLVYEAVRALAFWAFG